MSFRPPIWAGPAWTGFMFFFASCFSFIFRPSNCLPVQCLIRPSIWTGPDSLAMPNGNVFGQCHFCREWDTIHPRPWDEYWSFVGMWLCDECMDWCDYDDEHYRLHGLLSMCNRDREHPLKMLIASNDIGLQLASFTLGPKL